jgi:hypothetical protein
MALLTYAECVSNICYGIEPESGSYYYLYVSEHDSQEKFRKLATELSTAKLSTAKLDDTGKGVPAIPVDRINDVFSAANKLDIKYIMYKRLLEKSISALCSRVELKKRLEEAEAEFNESKKIAEALKADLDTDKYEPPMQKDAFSGLMVEKYR